MVFLLSVVAFGADPSVSRLASGRWVKIRVDSAGVYQLTADELSALGFDSPEKVNVYGFNPTLLLSHSASVIPSDIDVIPSIFTSGKLVFYAMANTDLEPEIWRNEPYKASVNQTEAEYPTPAQFEHRRHIYSAGATYFLSDSEPRRSVPELISAPSGAASAIETHSAIIFYEQDTYHYGVGGLLFMSDRISNPAGTVTYPFSVRKVASESARLLFQALDSYGGKKSPLIASFSPEIKTQASVGASLPIVATTATHQMAGLYRRFQQILLPEEQESRNYQLTFSVNPEFTSFNGAAIDYWALVYDRHNDLSGESVLPMCFDSKRVGASRRFAVRGISDADGADWHFWDVTSPLKPKECLMSSEGDGSLTGEFASLPSEFAAAYVVAFDAGATLPSPEIIGTVENQNLHGMSTPDAVIVTSSVFSEVAEELAGVHRRLQGLDVRVVDQQDIFNEYGSGNISPESVRLFLAHLNRKNPGRLKALILLGSAVVDNAREVYEGSPAVVTAQNECHDDDTYEVRSFFSDTFYGRFSEPNTSGNWGVRHTFYQVHGNDMDIAVGRIPLSSPAEIRDYIAKVEEYISTPPTSPAPVTYIVASDYEGTAGAAMHYIDSENVAKPLSDRFGKEFTLVRPASNFLSNTNNKFSRAITIKTLRESGANLMLYFGHGRPDALGYVKGDYYIDLVDVESYSSPGKYPFMFLGSCNVGRSDVNPRNICAQFLKSEHGGAIGMVAATREVFQQENTVIGLQFVKEYDAAADGTTWGEVYRRAQSKAVAGAATNRRTMLNHLCYSFLGDPLIPIYKAEKKVNIERLNSDNQTVYVNGANLVEGSIMNADGSVDSEFNGSVLLNLFDVPIVRKNLVAKGTSIDSEYLASITEDNVLIRSIRANVKNGKFSVEFNAPRIFSSGNQRLQAYAFTSDGASRAVGYLGALTSTDEHDVQPAASRGDLKIRSLVADNASFDSSAEGGVMITADIYSPNGLGPNGLLGSSIRFAVDGMARSEASQMITFEGNDIFRLVYPIPTMSPGRHTVELLVTDETGASDYSELEFAFNDAPKVDIWAESPEAGVLEVNTSADKSLKSRVVVETLDGTLVRRLDASSFPVRLTDMPAGVYRVYTQHSSDHYHTSSPKTEVFID